MACRMFGAKPSSHQYWPIFISILVYKLQRKLNTNLTLRVHKILIKCIFCHLLHIHSGETGILFSVLLRSLWWMQIVGYVLSEMFVLSYSVTYCIYIPRKSGFYFHYYWAVYNEWKESDMFWLEDRIRLFVHYMTSLSSLCKLIWRHWTYKNVCQIYFVE